MDRPRILRYLRISTTAVCLVACVLLTALWVRSYWVIEGIGRISRTPSETTVVMIGSNHGTVDFSRRIAPTDIFPGVTDGWSYETARPEFATKHRFSWIHTSDAFRIKFPTWLPAIVLYGVAVIPWIGLRWRFSLRTLLIATTLLAIILGLVVYVAG